MEQHLKSAVHAGHGVLLAPRRFCAVAWAEGEGCVDAFRA